MPIKKTTTRARSKKTASSATESNLSSQEQDTLREFEQFVSSRPRQSSKGKSWLALTLIVLIVILGSAWFFMSQTSNLTKSNKFKAVYLENGETYYAKVAKEDALNIYLSDVYYIQLSQQYIQPEPTEEDEQPEPQIVEVPILVKRGEELHRPQGFMQINRSKVVAIEEIGDDSEIIQEINRLNQVPVQ